MLVKFYTTCDKCGAESPHYSKWPECRECGDFICPNCRAEDPPYICKQCQSELGPESLEALELN